MESTSRPTAPGALRMPHVYLLGALALAACDPSERQPGAADDDDSGAAIGEGTQTPPPPGSANENPAIGGSIGAPADTVDVILTDFAIEMPTSLRSGPTAFRVRNAGAVPHNIEIESDATEETFPQNLEPGESGVLVVDLTPGAWEVYCPVGDHDDRGMRIDLAVQ
jgi:hypothetical protein